MQKLNFLFFISFILYEGAVYSANIHCYCDDKLITLDSLHPQIYGTIKNEIRAKVALELDSIRIIDAHIEKYKIDSFGVALYADTFPIDSFVFKGSIAPNFFKKFRLYTVDNYGQEKENIYTGFSIIAYYSDFENKKYKSKCFINYFSFFRR